MRRTKLLTSVVSQISVQIPWGPLQKLATLVIILTATWIISRILGGVVSKALGKRTQVVGRQTRRIMKWLIWSIGILTGLDQLGLDLTILLAIAILAGISIVIALRDMLLDVTSHEVIATYNPFNIGDWIQVDRSFGRVVDITWMSTILMTPDNEMVYIPNSKITKSIVINRTSPGGIRIRVPITVDEALDLSEAEKTLLEIGTELSEELVPDSKPEVRVTNVNNHSTKIVLLLKINNPAKARLIASEVRKKAKKRLEEIKRRMS